MHGEFSKSPTTNKYEVITHTINILMFVNRLSKHMQGLGQMEVIGIAHVLKVILGVEIKLKMKKIVHIISNFQ